MPRRRTAWSSSSSSGVPFVLLLRTDDHRARGPRDDERGHRADAHAGEPDRGAAGEQRIHPAVALPGAAAPARPGGALRVVPVPLAALHAGRAGGPDDQPDHYPPVTPCRAAGEPRGPVALALARDGAAPQKQEEMSDEFWRALIDPSAPLPHNWPVGALGAFLLFCVPIGGGIPAGVLMGRNAGLSPPPVAGLYFFSPLLLAFTLHPVLLVFTWLGRWIPPLARVGTWLRSVAQRAGAGQPGARGPLGLVLVAFGVDPMTGRAAAAAAGHGFVQGWAIAITGDMLYFVVLMISTLW